MLSPMLLEMGLGMKSLDDIYLMRSITVEHFRWYDGV